MISLQDKIQKFQKLIYNKELDDFIPIDEQFIGGGITMQSLIKQNSFMVSQIKKMKNVFTNYCKLNKNVYEKITEHQLALHSQTNKIHNIASSIEQKLNDTIRQVKQMYEQMKYESVRTKNLVNQAVKPIQQAIKTKVDQNSFNKQIKKILSQIQDQQHTQLHQGHGQSGSLTAQDGFVKRKKGRPLTQDQYQVQKQRNARLFMQLSAKIQQLQIKSQEQSPILYKNTSQINKLVYQVDNSQNQIFKLNRDSKQIRAMINSTEQRLLNQIFAKTSDNVWQRKLAAFQSNSVIPKVQRLSNEMVRNQQQNNKSFAELQPRFSSVKTDLEGLDRQMQKHSENLQNIKIDLEEISRKLIEEIAVMEGKLNVVYNEKKVKIQQVHEKIDSQIQTRINQAKNLAQDLNQLGKNVQNKVLVAVKKNIQLKINEIDKNLHNLSNKQKSIQEEMFCTKGEIHSIKEVLSKKANFTDILIHFQRKADKQDFKELKDKIQTTPSHLRSTIMETPNRTTRTISANSRKRSSLSKNLIVPTNAMNDDRTSLESDNEGTSRLFMMGLENDLPFSNERRRMSCTESGRRKKKIKSGVFNLIA